MTSIEKSPKAQLVPFKTQGHWTPFVNLMRALAAHGINLKVCLTKIPADELRILMEKGQLENVDIEIVEAFRDTIHIPNTHAPSIVWSRILKSTRANSHSRCPPSRA
ncbi:hypothetical protein MPTK1_5g19840 [Marchantia polymorpha subsp. ruderalis]|uniref:Uncharacterized protein n=2 Tax=Marchantia polymorpha TaxID=3197 RepID=A0AAF6BK75_MARPO|nr:hypothetical protein MARPO_0409s0001 [Marchantia polymorpha]BBN12409.1 hypothetical protein Mp_5g19840 [Marchantia polymorpha subsp. ruderalis]|eukprot:PTQ26773.1 hypothetical protein MARPO_0409s0001 [Marchantia polymorpha]